MTQMSANHRFSPRTVAICSAILISGCEPEIIEFPDVYPLSANSVEIRWATDRPSDSQIEFGFDELSNTVSQDDKTTQHALTLDDLEPGSVYQFKVSSSNLWGADDYQTIMVVPDQLALILSPHEEWISGEVDLRASPADTEMHVTQAQFSLRAVDGEQWQDIGLDTDGTGDAAACFQSFPDTGDGWSTTLDTREIAEGAYELRVVLASRLGELETTQIVYIDPTPPTAEFENPVFGEEVSNVVSLVATASDGEKAVFQQRRARRVITLPVRGLTQTDYPFDRAGGGMMCDPTSEAAILWGYPDVRRRFSGRGDLLRKFIRWLAKAKRTNSKGTTRGNEQAAWRKIRRVIPGWSCKLIGTKTGALSFAIFKRAVTREGNKLKGATVHVKPRGKPKDPGHVMALVSVEDQPGGGGKLKLMDPLTGTEIEVDVAADGTFNHPTLGPVQLQWGNVITGPTAAAGGGGSASVVGNDNDKLASMLRVSQASPTPEVALPLSGWKTIDTDSDPSDGWQTEWDTSELESGPYWIRVTVSDANGHSDTDAVEVWVPSHP